VVDCHRGTRAISLAGVPNSTVKWLSVTAVALLGLVYYAIRDHTTGFGSYKQLLPLSTIQNLLTHVLIASAIVVAIRSSAAATRGKHYRRARTGPQQPGPSSTLWFIRLRWLRAKTSTTGILSVGAALRAAILNLPGANNRCSESSSPHSTEKEQLPD
jgi:hypothetical protein